MKRWIRLCLKSPVSLASQIGSPITSIHDGRRIVATARFDLAGGSGDPSGRAIDIQVTRLRRKIEADPANPRYLRTVRGRGYMLTPD